MRCGAWALVGVVAVGGCGGSEACIDFADEVLLTAQVTDNGERARIEVELRRADLGDESIPVKLCADNSVRVDDVEMTQVKRPNGAVVYEADLAQVSEQAVVARRFVLASGDEVSEFTATIDAPGFAITGPTIGAEVSRAEMLAITWAPPRGGDATIAVKLADQIDGDVCLGEPLELDELDDGEVLVGMAELKLAKETAAANGACEAYVTLSRVFRAPLARSTGAASLHPDSVIQATTSRTVEFVSVP